MNTTTTLITQIAAACSGVGKDTSCTNDCFCTNLPQAAASAGNVQNIVHIVAATFGAIAILIIVIAALNIVTAAGDSSKVAKARSMILYALVGLVVTISADVIVSLVITRL